MLWCGLRVCTVGTRCVGVGGGGRSIRGEIEVDDDGW